MARDPKSVALVGGQLRDEIEFRLTLSKLCQFRSEGLIDTIILSTWRGEIDKYPTLRQELEDASIIQVEGYEAAPSVGNSWAQMKALDQGLRFIEPDQTVCRLRTDRSIHVIGAFRPFLTDGAPSADYFGSRKPLFQSKIIMPAVMLSQPFAAADIAYLGQAQDLARLVSYDGVYDSQFNGFGAEHRLYNTPFIKAYPSLARFYESIDYIPLTTAMVEAAQRGIRVPDILIRFYAFYWVNLAQNLRTVDKRMQDTTQHVSFEMALGQANWDGVRIIQGPSTLGGCKVSILNDNRILPALTDPNGGCSDSQNDRYYRECLRELWQGRELDIAPTPKDVKHLIEFGDTLGIKVYRPSFKASVPQKPTRKGGGIDFLHQDKILAGLLAETGMEEIDPQFLSPITEMYFNTPPAVFAAVRQRQAALYFYQAAHDSRDTPSLSSQARILAKHFIKKALRGSDIEAVALYTYLVLTGYEDQADIDLVGRFSFNAALRGDAFAAYCFLRGKEQGLFEPRNNSAASLDGIKSAAESFDDSVLSTRYAWLMHP